MLVTLRPEHVHQGGLWEFPGGKLESGEDLARGLERELREELGIRVLASEALIRVHHDYVDRHVLLDVHRITQYSGEPHGREGQPMRWQHPDDMQPADFPAADRPIINALRLPDRMLITGADPAWPEEFLTRMERALNGGVRLVQLRAHGLIPDGYLRLSQAVQGLCRTHGANLVLNPPDRMSALPPGDGLHLGSRRLMALHRRPPEYALVGASCHDAAELRQAEALGLDYALLSPVMPTASHPDAIPLGWGEFSRLAEPALLPVYALGGMGVQDIQNAKRCGGQGIATISGLWPEYPLK